MEEITGVYVRQRHQWDETIVGEIISDGHRVSIKGKMDDEHPKENMTYRFFGKWGKYQSKWKSENQFQFRTLVQTTPHTQNGIVRYLKKAPKIGQALGQRLWDTYMGEAVAMLREEPEQAAEAIKGLSEEGAIAASKWLKEHKDVEDTAIQLIDLLDGRGFPLKTHKATMMKWGNKAPEFITQNPYGLMQFPGCGFLRTDKLHLDLGGNPASLKRQALCAWHAISTNTSGDTWLLADEAEQAIRVSIGGAECNFPKAMRLATRAGLLSTVWTNGDGPRDWDGDTQWIAHRPKADNERCVAKYLDAADDELPWPVFADEVQGISGHQQAGLSKALSGGSIAILGGSPGTGKTYTAAAFIKLVMEQHGRAGVAVCAPTGKAAVRVTEAMTEYGLGLRAKTIHSMLGVQEYKDGVWTFEHHAGNPLPYKFIVVDETSMCGIDIMAAFLAARAPDTKILFVGDVNQLPPVEHGAPLRDMIKAKLPYGELVEIRRNAGQIVKACAAMRDGVPFECGGNLNDVDVPIAENQRHAVIGIIAKERDLGLDPIWDVQVVVAVNQKSELSRMALNQELQQYLNPGDGNPNPKCKFRNMDKVVCLKNGFYGCVEAGKEARVNESGNVYVANGELGQITEMSKAHFVADLSNPRRRVRVPLWSDADNGINWDLAYALTVHKMQGSEAPVVIVLVDEYPGAKWVCDRAWMYTAISRAKKTCYLVGQLETAHKFCRVNNIKKRKTFLEEMI
jgi:exodeoxyribonuclease V alpha subunit